MFFQPAGWEREERGSEGEGQRGRRGGRREGREEEEQGEETEGHREVGRAEEGRGGESTIVYCLFTASSIFMPSLMGDPPTHLLSSAFFHSSSFCTRLI